MTGAAGAVLSDALDRVHADVTSLLDGLDRSDLTHRVQPDANTVGWLVWHLLRVQDDHVSEVAGVEQAWTSGGWFDRSGLPFDADATGYGHTSAEVAATDVDPELLVGYADAVHEQSSRFVAQLGDADLDRVVDDSWDPPVTLGVRLLSVVEDDLKHLGQAELLVGMLPAE